MLIKRTQPAFPTSPRQYRPQAARKPHGLLRIDHQKAIRRFHSAGIQIAIDTDPRIGVSADPLKGWLDDIQHLQFTYFRETNIDGAQALVAGQRACNAAIEVTSPKKRSMVFSVVLCSSTE